MDLSDLLSWFCMFNVARDLYCAGIGLYPSKSWSCLNLGGPDYTLITAVFLECINKSNGMRVICVSFCAERRQSVALTSLGIASSCELVGADTSNPAK